MRFVQKKTLSFDIRYLYRLNTVTVIFGVMSIIPNAFNETPLFPRMRNMTHHGSLYTGR